ncbi:hypothetical protein V1481_16635 [Aeromonas enteropelogenes]|uniref:Uncharacterized protein n=1 Tax=Aeromonas sp. 19NY04SH05-1 TaxID=2920537 RepID=A0AAU6T885_9GAMM
MTELGPDVVMLNGRQIDFMDIHIEGPLMPLNLLKAQGGGGVKLGDTGQKIRLSIDPDSSDWQWLESLSRQKGCSLDFECAHIGTLRKKIGKRGQIDKIVHDTWYLEFPDWEISQ